MTAQLDGRGTGKGGDATLRLGLFAAAHKAKDPALAQAKWGALLSE